MSEWQKIESAPQDESILASDLYKTRITKWDSWNRVWFSDEADQYGDVIPFYPTHWMPLPAPPQDDK